MRRIGAVAALGVMATTIGMLVVAGGDANEPANLAPAGQSPMTRISAATFDWGTGSTR